MTKDLVDILAKVRTKITDESDLVWTSFETAHKLRNHIDSLIARLQQGDKEVLEDIYLEFAPTSTFQEHSMQNGWSDEYLKLASQFDKIYDRLK